MTGSRQKHGGWILSEAVISLSVMGMLLGGLAIAQGQFRTFNALQMARHRCIAAAEAQLDSIAATASPLEPEETRRMWDGIRAEIEQTQGRGDWAGLTKVKVTSSTAIGGRQIKVTLVRYIPGGKEQP